MLLIFDDYRLIYCTTLIQLALVCIYLMSIYSEKRDKNITYN